MQEERPIINLQTAPVDKIIDRAGVMLLLLLWVLTVLAYFHLPETIPVHFNASGKADGYGGKATLFLLPVIATILFAGITALAKYPHIYNYPYAITLQNAAQQYRLASRMMRVLKLALVTMFVTDVPLTYFTEKGVIDGLGFWFLPLELGIVIVPIVFYMWKLAKAK